MDRNAVDHTNDCRMCLLFPAWCIKNFTTLCAVLVFFETYFKEVVFTKQRLRLTVAFALSEMLAWRPLHVGVSVQSS